MGNIYFDFVEYILIVQNILRVCRIYFDCIEFTWNSGIKLYEETGVNAAMTNYLIDSLSLIWRLSEVWSW